jgi:tetratricopeptide (TPR) repeat protein
MSPLSKSYFFLCFILVGCSGLGNKSSDSIYQDAQKAFHKKRYDKSLSYFKDFIEENKNTSDSQIRKKIFWSVDQVGRIYLKIQKNPDRAIKFFESLPKKLALTDAESDDISEWLAVSKEWKKLGKLPKHLKKPEELYFYGEKFYQQGMDKIEYPADSAGNADFYIASTYLVPYVYNFNKGKHIGKALFMLGNIRFRSWNDYEYWTENYYLKEVIRRFPKSKLAKKAYKVLHEGVHAGYTGSGGDTTPSSQVKMLKYFKKLAY